MQKHIANYTPRLFNKRLVQPAFQCSAKMVTGKVEKLKHNEGYANEQKHTYINENQSNESCAVLVFVVYEIKNWLMIVKINVLSFSSIKELKHQKTCRRGVRSAPHCRR